MVNVKLGENTYDGVKQVRLDTTDGGQAVFTLGEGYDAGYEACKQAEYDRFWESYQENGERSQYTYAFSYSWNDAIYNPKYPITITANAHGIAIYTYSNVTDTKVDIIATANVHFNGTFANAKKLVTIRKIVIISTCTFTNAFTNASALTNLTLEGVLGTNGFDVSYCPLLTHDSLMSVINALQQKTSGTWTVTFGETNLAKLTDAEKAIATEKGWTLA